jgi:hypothetical protein
LGDGDNGGKNTQESPFQMFEGYKSKKKEFPDMISQP